MVLRLRILTVLLGTLIMSVALCAQAAYRCEQDLNQLARPSEAERPAEGPNFVGTANFEHLAGMAEFLIEHGLPSPFVGNKHLALENSGVSNEEKARRHAELYADFKKRIGQYVMDNIDDPEFRDAAGHLLAAYYNRPPLSGTGEMELPGWINMEGDERPTRVENWRHLYQQSRYARPWSTTMNTLKNLDGFADLLAAPRYSEPEARLDQLTRMQFAVAMTALSDALEEDLLRRTEFGASDGAEGEPIQGSSTPGRVDIPTPR